MSFDRKAVNVLLAVLGIEQRELAELMGYRPAYLANVLNGETAVSRPFRATFGAVLAELLLGPPRPRRESYPAEPLAELIRRRAAAASSKRDFYERLGIGPDGWNRRQMVSGAVVDRVCCALGVHPSAIYGRGWNVQEAS